MARILQRHQLNRLANLEPAAPTVRYEYPRPGDLLLLDIKKLGRFRRPGHRVAGDQPQDSRGEGWEYVHVAIDDHCRIASSTIHPDEAGNSACAVWLQAVRYYRCLGLRFECILTDNSVCQRLGQKHLRINPYTRRTNGKVVKQRAKVTRFPG